jgi:hypothetical protein
MQYETRRNRLEGETAGRLQCSWGLTDRHVVLHWIQCRLACPNSAKITHCIKHGVESKLATGSKPFCETAVIGLALGAPTESRKKC